MNFFLFIFHLFLSQHAVIDLQPFSDVSPAETEYVFNKLKKVYPHIELKESIDLPQIAFTGRRYRADTLIHYLSAKTITNHTTVGITTKDISTTKGRFSDWGIMGLSYCPGKACIVSSFRLNKVDRQNQLFKVAIHELGHTQGLSHCPYKYCYMRDAEGKNTTGEETGFCMNCQLKLMHKGWMFK